MLGAVEYPAEFRTDGGDAEHRPVEVQPGAMLAGDFRDRGGVVDGSAGGRAEGRADVEGNATCRRVLVHQAFELVGPHRERLGITCDQPEVRPAQAGHAARLLDRGVCVLAGVRDERRTGTDALTSGNAVGGPFPGRQ